MNILIVNQELNEVYLADEDILKIFELDLNLSLALKTSLNFSPIRNETSRINHMMLKTSLTEQLLVILTHTAMVYIYFPQS